MMDGPAMPFCILIFIVSCFNHFYHPILHSGLKKNTHYAHLIVTNAGELINLPKNTSIPITLNAREYEVFTVVPINEMSTGSRFAPIGLVNMFNSGGAIKEVKYETEGKCGLVSMKVRGCGTFGAYSSGKPKRIHVDNEEVQFDYDESSGLFTINITVPDQELYLWDVKVET